MLGKLTLFLQYSRYWLFFSLFHPCAIALFSLRCGGITVNENAVIMRIINDCFTQPEAGRLTPAAPSR